MKSQRIEISYKTIIFIAVFLLSLALLWELRHILVLFYICLVLMAALNPTVTKLENSKIPRGLSIISIYLLTVLVISVVFSGLIPILVEQTSLLITSLPHSISDVQLLGVDLTQIFSQFQLIDQIPSNLARLTVTLVSNIFSLFVVFVITFYLLIERKKLAIYTTQAFGQEWKTAILSNLERIEHRLGSWVNAEFLLMTLIGALSYIGYLLIGLPYALPIAILAGLLEVVPNIGPTVSTIIAAIIGLTISPVTGLLALLVGIIVQQLENNLIVPRIMRSAVGLNPLITILTITSGAQLGGVIGAILAVPTFLILETIITYLLEQRDKTKKRGR